MPYIITGSINKYFENWEECRRAYTGQRGIRWQRVSSRDEGEAILSGRGVVLPPGVYAFTDGSGEGGVGLVIVRMEEGSNDPGIDLEVASSVGEVISSSDFSSLSRGQIDASIKKSPSTIAEMCAALMAVQRLPEKSKATIVHDWVGVADWLEERVRRSKDPVIRQIVSVALSLRREKALSLDFHRQPGHRSAWAGRHDFAAFNKLADDLADQGVRGPR